MSDRKVAIVIPSRYGSNRFPGKALHLLNHKPIITHVWERCMKSQNSDHVVVATDDIRIAAVINEIGGNVFLSDTPHNNGTERCTEFAIRNPKFETIINVQGDEVFVDVNDIDKLIDSVNSNQLPSIASLYIPGVSIAQQNDVNCVKITLSAEERPLNFFRSIHPAADGVHVGIYGYRRNTLLDISQLPISAREKEFSLEQLRWLDNGFNIDMLESSSSPISINVPADIKKAQEHLIAVLSHI